MNRRQLLASTAIGSVLGAAWGTSFLASELDSDHPTVTIYRTIDFFSMLIEHDTVRVLLLDGEEPNSFAEVTESITGFLRQRIDVVLASDPTLSMMPSTFVDRWNVSAVYAVPDKSRSFATPLDGNALSIGGLTIAATGAAAGSWRTSTDAASQPWRVTVQYGSACCIYGSSWEALAAMAPPPEPGVTMCVTNDPRSRLSMATKLDIIALPEASLDATDAADIASIPAHVVRLYRHYPITVQLRPESILLPHQS